MHDNRTNELAADVRLSFVRSLYTKRSTLLIGMLSHVFVSLLVYHNTNQTIFLYFAVGIFVIWVLRTLNMNKFDYADQENFSLAETQYWERRYVSGAVSISFLLGLITAYTFVFSNSVFAQLATVSVTFATLIAVVGRNFGSKINVDMMVLAVCLPILFGFLGSDDMYVKTLALLLLPVFLSTRTLANGVRNVLYSSVMSQRESAVLASRLDGAINNMSHGLIMIDANKNIRVINHNAKNMLGIPSNVGANDRNFKVFLRYALKNGAFTRQKLKETRHEISLLVEGERSRMMLEVNDNYFLEFSARHQNDNGVVIIFEDVTSKVHSDQKILHMARYDVLTNIPNRKWFKQLIDQKIDDIKSQTKTDPVSKKAGLAVFDIIDFKHINNTRNHLLGDNLLCAVAKRLQEFAASNNAIISRFGGDEFVAFFSCDDEKSIKHIMDELFLHVCKAYELNGDELNINFAAGLVIQPATRMQFENMQICADIALRDARRRGNNIWSLFVPTMDEKYKERQKLKFDLRKALEKNTLNIAYQPMFTPDGLNILGAEALSRWQHPELGPISPEIYIPLAEEIGGIRDLTRNMVINATKDCTKWPDHMFVSVNLSAFDLIDHEIINVISQALDSTGLNPDRLHLEITESAVVDKPEHAAIVLREMRQMGISIAIDDFGTGYSSLSYLDKLPFNKVKIDRSFIKNIINNDRKLKLLRGIVRMSRELGLDIVIEGIETDEQLQLICENKCADIIQGFIFGIPMPHSELIELSCKVNRSIQPQIKTKSGKLKMLT